MVAAYSTPTSERYVGLWPRRDLGNDLALALIASGQRKLYKAPIAYAIVSGRTAQMTTAKTLEDARLCAIEKAVAGVQVTIAERIGLPEAHLFVLKENVVCADRLPAGGSIIGLFGKIEKAIDVRSPQAFNRIVDTLSGQLAAADYLATKPALTAALRKLDLNWAKLSEAEVAKVFETFNNTLKKMGASKIAGYAQKVTMTALVVAGGARKQIKAKFLPRIGVSLTSADQKMIQQIGTQQGWFLRDEFGRRSDAVTAMGRRVVTSGLKAGLGSYEISDDLMKQVPGMWKARGRAYADVVASNALVRARTYSELSSYTEGGVEMMEVVAILDERTSDICRALDGQLIPVDGAMGIATAAANVKRPEDVARVSPFVQQRGNRLFGGGGKLIATVQRSGVGNANDRGTAEFEMMGGQLLGGKIGAPPYHFNCRSMTIPRTRGPRIPSGRVARSELPSEGTERWSDNGARLETFRAPSARRPVTSGSPAP